MGQDQMTFYFFIAVAGLFVWVLTASIFKKSGRKNVFQSFAQRHALRYTKKIAVSPLNNVGQTIAARFKEASEKRRLSQTPGVDEQTARKQAARTRRQSLALKRVPPGSVLADPYFYDASRTDAILNYCAGRHGSYGLEVFEEIVRHNIRHGSDRSDIRRTETVNTDIAFKLKGADLPAFQILPLTGGAIAAHPNRMPVTALPGFDDQFAVIVDAAEADLRDRIDRLLTSGALQALLRLAPVGLQAKGEFVRLSRRIPRLDEAELDQLLQQGLQVVEHISRMV